MSEQHTMAEWQRMIAERRTEDKAAKGKKPIKQQLAEAKAKVDELNAARKKAAAEPPTGEQEHIIDILND